MRRNLKYVDKDRARNITYTIQYYCAQGFECITFVIKLTSALAAISARTTSICPLDDAAISGVASFCIHVYAYMENIDCTCSLCDEANVQCSK